MVVGLEVKFFMDMKAYRPIVWRKGQIIQKPDLSTKMPLALQTFWPQLPKNGCQQTCSSNMFINSHSAIVQFFHGPWLAHRQCVCSTSPREVLQPAIELAEGGFPVSEGTAQVWKHSEARGWGLAKEDGGGRTFRWGPAGCWGENLAGSGREFFLEGQVRDEICNAWFLQWSRQRLRACQKKSQLPRRWK